MSLGRYIEDLRQKPEKDKVALALTLSLAICLVIFGFWLFNFNLILSVEKGETADQTKVQDLSPSASDSLLQGFDRLKNGWGVVGDQLRSFKGQFINSSSTKTQ